ncbi:rim21p [Saccharomyces arboricola H-6]|uniref:pH-response regulator protein palH/RIM21 n=1 Tax=Saccharomyces arboricola (strain H-6 / AS 2.3317 / CBS 10644) TaxID=1160507 RepID=J8PXP7_SACAR|nr:rim21p [Saccharomyces arboricola H-6]
MNLWRHGPEGSATYKSCHSMNLGPGVLIQLPFHENSAVFADDITFRSYCCESVPVYLSTVLKSTSPYRYLDQVIKDWQNFIHVSDYVGGSSQYAIYAVILSITSNFVITVFLTVICCINISGRAYKRILQLLRIASLLASLNLTIFITKVLRKLERDHNRFGIVRAHSIMHIFTDDMTFVVLDFLATLLFQFCQVGIVIRLFQRAQEKRIIFFIGVLLTITANILWVIPPFANHTTKHKSNWQLLRPFVYLFRIAIATSYASIVIYHIWQKKKLWFKFNQMGLLTLLTILVVLLLPGFFLADVSNLWISELGEVFNTTCYVTSTVITWEWLDRLNVLERREEAQSILGRPIFEEEQQDYRFAKYALRVQNALTRRESNESSIGADDTSNSSEICDLQTISRYDPEDPVSEGRSIDQMHFNDKGSYKDLALKKVSYARDKILYFTDQIVQKSVGHNNNSNSSKNEKKKQRKAMVRKRLGLDRPGVYIYSTKEVVFDSDQDGDEDEDEYDDNDDNDQNNNDNSTTFGSDRINHF